MVSIAGKTAAGAAFLSVMVVPSAAPVVSLQTFFVSNPPPTMLPNMAVSDGTVQVCQVNNAPNTGGNLSNIQNPPAASLCPSMLPVSNSLAVVADTIPSLTAPVIICYDVTAAGQSVLLPGPLYANPGTGVKITW